MSEKRTETIAVVVTKETKQVVRNKAARRGVTMSTYINEIIQEALQPPNVAGTKAD